MQNIKYLIRVVAIYILRFCMRVLRFIPIKNNRIIFTSCQGKQYSCNPRYISEYLKKKYPEKFDIIWILNDPEQYGFLASQGVKVIKNHFFKKMYFELTAKISILNNGTRYAWLKPRKGQMHINTWHGGGYYKLTISNDMGRTKLQNWPFVLASQNTSYFLSTNKCFTENEIKYDFAYLGEVLNIGFPRNDIFFHCDYTEIRKKVCHYFGINENSKILMYAPTFRDGKFTEFSMPDFEKLKEVAANRFGGEWAVLIRMHYYSGMEIKNSNSYNANYKPDGPEMQELLAACDMLISDYSSCIWDYSFTYRPCLLFTPDLDEYIAGRGFGIDIYEWGFPVCKTEQELWDAIDNYDPIEFRKAMERHHEDLGSFEHGNATEIMGKLIYDFCFPEQTSD